MLLLKIQTARNAALLVIGMVSLSCITVSPLHAADAQHTRARLVADVQSIAPGTEFTVGVLMTMDAGWHTYWKNPGEAGLATSIKWELPPGITAGEIQWPLPHKYNESGEVLSYGYADENMLLIPMRVTPGVRLGTKLRLKGRVDWLECERVCVPGSAEVELTIPVSSSPGKKTNAELFQKYRSQIPQRLGSDAGITVNTATSRAGIELTIIAGENKLAVERDVTPDFFPEPTEQLIVGRTTQSATSVGARVLVPLSLPEEAKRPDSLSGILIFQLENGRRQTATVTRPLSMQYLATLSMAGGSGEPISVLNQQFTNIRTTGSGQPLYLYVIYAIVGGILLNIMPCVLPVISLKVFGLVKMSGDDPRKVKRLGWFFSFGILASFLLLAILVVTLKAAGEQVGWGFQFQEPLFVIAMSAVVFAFGLSLFGVYEITVPGVATTGLSDAISRKGRRGEGYAASFWEGVFATILATPCTAPILGTALGFAFSQPWWIILLIFVSTAFGMALPYLLLTMRPAWMKFLPKPGAWMETAKQFMGFLMMATLLWLLYVLGKQLGMEGVIWTSAWLLIVGLGCWLIGRFATLVASQKQRTITWAAAILLVAVGYWFFLESTLNVRQVIAGTSPASQGTQTGTPEGIQWQPFSVASLDAHLKTDKTVFIDFTAEWCLTCKVNEKTVLASKDVVEEFKKHEIVALKADWTNRNPEITRLLQKFGRSGVPLYVIFPAGRPHEPMVLPEVVTPGIVTDAIKKAVTT